MVLANATSVALFSRTPYECIDKSHSGWKEFADCPNSPGSLCKITHQRAQCIGSCRSRPEMMFYNLNYLSADLVQEPWNLSIRRRQPNLNCVANLMNTFFVRVILVLIVACALQLPCLATEPPPASALPAGASKSAFRGVSSVDARVIELIGTREYQTAIELLEKKLAENQSLRGGADAENIHLLTSLGMCRQETGDLSGARKTFEDAIEIATRTGLVLEDTVSAMNSLSIILCNQGDYTSARTVLERALASAESVFGPTSGTTASLLRDLASVYDACGEEAKAIAFYNRAMKIMEQVAPESLPLASAYNDLGTALVLQGNYSEAFPLLNKALALKKTKLGPRNPAVADCLNNIAIAYTENNHPEEALPRLTEALSIYEQQYGTDHIALIPALNNLGDVSTMLKDPKNAAHFYLRGTKIIDGYFCNNLANMSVTEQYCALDAYCDRNISRVLTLGAPEVSDAYQYFFRWKGTLIQSLINENELRRHANSPDLQGKLDQLAKVRSTLSSWYQEAGHTPFLAWSSRNTELTTIKERLEREIRGGQSSSTKLGEPTLQQFKTQLKQDEAFIDFYKHTLIRDGYELEPAYSCVVTAGGASTLASVATFGDASKIESFINDWRSEVTAGGEGTKNWQQLIAVFTACIAKLPGSVRRVWICPDGELARLPWQLIAEQINPTLSVCQIDSARVLTTANDTGDKHAANPAIFLEVGAPDFNAGAETRLSTFNFSFLPGTVREIREVGLLARQCGMTVEQITGAEVTKQRLLNALPHARFVHLATHGFFFDESFMNDVRMQLPEKTRGISVTLKQKEPLLQNLRNPLVQSGIALAGANKLSGDDNKGVLTAEEFIGTDLRQCDLVTLSACDTGRGKELTGQGVMGLRASIMAAGPRNILMSLWKIPDESTVLLMKLFYSNLWEKHMPPAMALHAAQSALRAQLPQKAKAPVYWAGWVLVGRGWNE